MAVATLLLVHGSATDATTWAVLSAHRALAQQYKMVAIQRPTQCASIRAQAEAIAPLVPKGPVVLVGHSFGAIVTLELIRAGLVQQAVHAVLMEPPLAPTEAEPAMVAPFVAGFDALLARGDHAGATARFLAEVLGDAYLASLPRSYFDRAVSHVHAIAADIHMLMRYSPQYGALQQVSLPMLLIGGGKSPPRFAATLATLAAHLPRAERLTIPHAGHMVHVEGARTLVRLLLGLVPRLAG